jgi:putative transposase
MSSSFVSNHVHVVFATKNRSKIIPEEFQPKLWGYLAGIAKNHGMHAVAIGGTADHAHALINVGALLNIAKAVQVLKANSSRWMNDHAKARFEWQEGYFACSVSRSQVKNVFDYIANQKEHHKRMDFAAEFALLLKKHGFEPLG